MTPKIIFITGAGSLAPYGFPTGNELKKEAIELCEKKFQSSEEMPFNKDRSWVRRFIDDLKASHRPSIDSFSFDHNDSDYCELCKLLVGYLLMPTTEEFIKQRKFSSGWLADLFNSITEFQDSPHSYKPENLLFLTFNYDRVIEYTINEQINYFNGIGRKEWANFFKGIQVRHVYGELLETIPHPEDGDTYSSKAQYARNLKLMRSPLENNDLDYPATFENAVRIYFMGFGFHDENLKKLGIHQSQPSSFAPGNYRINKIIDITCFSCEPWTTNQIEVDKLGITRDSVHVASSCEELIAKNSASIRELLSR